MLKNKDIAKKAFLDPVRSVLFIDDQFPTYEELVEGKAGDKNDARRAHSLVASCRKHHLVCDVRNSPDALARVEIERIGVSDLVVIDYHLRGEGQHNDDVLNFLSRLARSPHFNLAVVYTGQTELTTVRLNVAARVRGGPPPSSGDASAELPEVNIPNTSLETHVDDYLRDPRQLAPKIKELLSSDADRALIADRETWLPLLRRDFEPYLERTFSKNDPAIVPAGHLPVSMSENNKPVQWVQAGNVFVAIVKKENVDTGTAEIGSLLQKLTDAIVDWAPSLIDVMLTAAAGSVIRHGLREFTKNFEDEGLRSGLVYWFLTGDSAYGDFAANEPAGDRRARIEDLYRAVFELLANAASKEAADLTDAAVKEALEGRDPAHLSDQEKAAFAKNWAKTKGVSEQQMMVAANAYLCSTAFEGQHVTTGTVFRTVGDKPSYWLCVSAACDMVPRGQSLNTWRKQFFPLRMMLTARLTEVSAEGTLSEVHHGKHIFLCPTAGKVRAFEFMSKSEPEPQLSPLFASDAAKVTSGKFKAMALKKGDDGTLATESFTFEAVGQLRPNYASRLLQQTGQHLSRIGVDFLGTRPPKKNESKQGEKAAAPKPEASDATKLAEAAVKFS